MNKRQRPSATRDVGDRLKLHRRTLRLDGKDYNVITLRPGTDVRYSTNLYHNTWHILSDLHGARLLSRLMWGLSFQQPGTLVVIDQSFVDPNPFDASPGDPIVLVPNRLTPLTVDGLRQLQRRLPFRTPSDGTVRWLTHGLQAAAAARNHQYSERGQIYRAGHLLVLAATPNLLREWANRTSWMSYTSHGSDYVGLSDPDCQADGEIQIFNDYHRAVAAARIAREEVLREQEEPLSPALVNPLVWQRGAAVRERQRHSYLSS